jgi:hypothetical protein
MTGLFNPDPDADFLPSRIPGSKRHPIPDPGSATLVLMDQDGIKTNRSYKSESARLVRNLF